MGNVQTMDSKCPFTINGSNKARSLNEKLTVMGLTKRREVVTSFRFETTRLYLLRDLLNGL